MLYDRIALAITGGLRIIVSLLFLALAALVLVGLLGVVGMGLTWVVRVVFGGVP